MKKKIYIIIVFILLLISVSLYYTYAIDITIDKLESTSTADLTFNINIEENSSRTISVKAGETKYFDVFITNNNDATINYSLVYDSIEIDGIKLAQVDTSKNKVSELIEANTTHQISMVLINTTTSDYTYNIVPIVGYEKGGDLIVPSGYTKIEDVYEIPDIPKRLDDSGANPPDLVEGLVPIMYDTSKKVWVKANITDKNSQYKWYDYNAKKWANAVLVSSSYRNKFNQDTFEEGDIIPEDAILAYYVWIPRYKYKVFNINKEIGVDSYNAKNSGIDIIFEKEKATTGTIDCNYDFSILEQEGLSEKCSGTNEDYYTHPAFTFENIELRGIWVGKYEVANTLLNIRIKENLRPITGYQLTSYSLNIQKMNESTNEYGLTSTTDSHMIKNIEWGVAAYLTHSKYGMCNNNSCSEVGFNSYYNDVENEYKTGCGPQSNESYNNAAICNLYNTELGQLASTTGNIYGIYDMNGGTYEYVMGNMSSTSSVYTYYQSVANNYFTYSQTTAKYIDTYANGTSYGNQSAYNRARLGDATGEVTTTTTDIGWYNDYSVFAFSEGPWFNRGGTVVDGTNSGIFNFYGYDGSGSSKRSSRAILVSLN